MTCPWCPFSACPRCELQGGKAPEPQGDTASSECDIRTDVRENRTGNDERPTALTADRSEPPRFALPNQEAYPSW